jgi:DNA polymerase-4
MAALTIYSQWIDTPKSFAQTAVIYVDLGRLRPSEGMTIGQQITRRLCDRFGLTAVMGLASSKFVAYAASLVAGNDGVKLIPRGEEAAFLAPLPVSILPLDGETRRRLDLLGLRRMGQIVLLPRPALIAQFGRFGGTMHRLASGDDARRVAKFIPERIEQAAMDFDPPVDDRQILLNVLCKLAGDLAKRLETDHLTCSDITLMAHLQGGQAVETRRQLIEPISGALPLYRLCQTLLDKLTVRREVLDIGVQVSGLAPVKPRQLSLFDWGARQNLEEVLINLSARYGEGRFYRVMLNKKISYLPELGFHLDVVG